MNDTPTAYTFKNFEVKAIVTKDYNNWNRSPPGRLLNNLITAINEHGSLPKLIVMVLDDDMIRRIRLEDFAETQIKEITEWLVREVAKAVTIYKDFLPNKAKKFLLPHILWIGPPTHMNFGSNNNRKREIQNRALQNVVKQNANMSILQMIKFWEHTDSNLFVFDNYRFTSEGLKKYWLSIDSAVRFWDVAIFPKICGKKPFQCPKTGPGFNRYKWNKPAKQFQ